MTIDTKALITPIAATVALVRRELDKSREAQRGGMQCGMPKAVKVDCAMVERLCRIAEKQAARLAALEADNQRLRVLLSDVTSVAITMLYNSHRGDVLATFTVPELSDVVARSEHLQPERVEHIYRRGYEALTAGGA